MRGFVILVLAVLNVTAQDGVLARVSAHQDRFGAVSRQIWGSPELGYHERNSSALLQNELRSAGFTMQAGVANMPTAFIASWGSGKPIIGTLGEFDALPGMSQKDVPRQEPLKEGAPGQGCGHIYLEVAPRLLL